MESDFALKFNPDSDFDLYANLEFDSNLILNLPRLDLPRTNTQELDQN